MMSARPKDSNTRPVSVKQGVGEPNDYSGVWKCLDCQQLLSALVADVEDITSQLHLLNHTVSDIGNDSSSVKDIVTASLQVTDL